MDEAASGAVPQGSYAGWMRTNDVAEVLTRLFGELTEGVSGGGGFVLNTGDIGLLRSIEHLSAADASRSVHDGATIAAHAQHVRYGLSLMNQWAIDGGNPFANAKWDEAWKISTVGEAEWTEIRDGLGDEVRRWNGVLKVPRDVQEIELTGMMASVAHIAYHFGAIRQIDKSIRGPRDGTFA
jgi:hypothetical protein